MKSPFPVKTELLGLLNLLSGEKIGAPSYATMPASAGPIGGLIGRREPSRG